MTTELRPRATRSIAPPGRVIGLDVARCLALVGMISTHVLVSTDEDGVTFTQQLAGGRASALFAVLAGTSMALMSGRMTPVRGAVRHAVTGGLVVRALAIAGLGLVLGALETTIAVILTYYGVLFLLGLPFLGLRARSLALLSLGWLSVVPLVSHLLRPHLPAPSYVTPNPASLADPWQLLTELTWTGYYPAVPWLAYLFAGMAVGRLDLNRRRTPLVLLGIGAALAASSWLLSRALVDRPGVRRILDRTYDGPLVTDDVQEMLVHGLYGTTPTDSWWWLAVSSPHTATPFDLAHTIGSALLVIGACLLLGRLLPRLSAVVFGAGAMTLSLYSLHVLLRTQEAWPEHSAEMFLRHVAVVMVLGAVFRAARVRGPLEAVVARMSGLATDVVKRTPG